MILKNYSLLKNLLKIKNQLRTKTTISKKYSNTIECLLEQKKHEKELEKNLIEPFHAKNSYHVTDPNGLHLLYETFGKRLEILAETKPNDECFVFPFTHTRLTFSELKQKVDEFAQNLLNLGFQKGDRLAIMLPNIPEINISIYAAASIGVIVVLMNPAYQKVEIEYMLKKTKSKGLIMLENFKSLRHYDILTHICPELKHCLKGGLISKNLPDLKHVIVTNLSNKYEHAADTRYKGTWSFGELDKYNLSPLEKPIVEPEDVFALLFTSGTTGVPKAATLTQFSLQNTIHLGSRIHGSFESCRNICSPVPIFHTFGLVLGCLAPLIISNKVVIPNYFPETLSILKSIHKEKCTTLNGAPVIFNDLLSHPKRKEFDLSSLELAILAASDVSKNLIHRVKNELNTKYILVGYGMTETAGAGSLTKCSDIECCEKHAYESIGTSFPFTEVKVVDPNTGLVLPHDKDGELYMRGYHLMKGYWDEPERTSEAIDKNGWLKTGDIVSMDKDGYLYFKSRAKEIVIRGGINIYPAEIEKFLISYDPICSVSVFGYPDDRNGEEMCAWIRLKDDVKNVNADDIFNYCKDKIALFKIPKYIKFVKTFPINSTGKILKNKMQIQMLNDLNNLPVENLFKIN